MKSYANKKLLVLFLVKFFPLVRPTVDNLFYTAKLISKMYLCYYMKKQKIEAITISDAIRKSIMTAISLIFRVTPYTEQVMWG